MIKNKAKLLLEYHNRIRSINRGQNDSPPVTFAIKSSKYKTRMLRNEEDRDL